MLDPQQLQLLLQNFLAKSENLSHLTDGQPPNAFAEWEFAASVKMGKLQAGIRYDSAATDDGREPKDKPRKTHQYKSSGIGKSPSPRRHGRGGWSL